MSNQHQENGLDRGTTGSAKPVFFIAHIGLNHNGRAADARRLIKQADAAGADAVCLPVYRTDSVVSEEADLVPNRRDHVGDLARNQRNMLGRCELAPEAIEDLRALARDHGLDFIPSPRDGDSLSHARTLDPSALLLNSGDLTFTTLLDQFRESGLTLLLSTGMATLKELDHVVERLQKGSSSVDLSLLYQVCCYPAEPSDLDLNTISQFITRYEQPTGFLDHTTSPQAAETAVALGASVIVKHLTTNRAAQGPHHAISLEPESFHSYVQRIRTLETSLGAGEKKLPDAEQQIRPFLRRSLAVTCSVGEGETLRDEHLTALRPARGIPANQLEDVTGTCLTTRKHAGEILYPEDISSGDEGETP